jgi:hypothetical protein
LPACCFPALSKAKAKARKIGCLNNLKPLGLRSMLYARDSDGQSNLSEYLANTNPANAALVLRVTDVARQPNGHFDLMWSSVGGTRYRIQFNDAAAPAGLTDAFTDIVRPLANEMDLSPYGAASTQAFTDNFTLPGGAPTSHARFYRIKLVP